jgi:hypothetical protein
MKFVATKTAEQLDLQALHRVRERLVSQRTGNCTRFPAEQTARPTTYLSGKGELRSRKNTNCCVGIFRRLIVPAQVRRKIITSVRPLPSARHAAVQAALSYRTCTSAGRLSQYSPRN